MSFNVIQTEFEMILPLWQSRLWPERQSEIKAVSSIDSRGEIDMNILNYAPVFFKAEMNGEIVGVISGFQTADSEFRSRGIWVDESHRNLRIASTLMRALENHAADLGLKTLWSMPRNTAIGFYLKYGFQVTGETHKYEYGPHYLVSKEIRRLA